MGIVGGKVMPAVSIIVPVYNVEKYLRKCLDSILGQTFSDIEVILVEDCSADASKEICREYADKDERIRCIWQPQNGGLGRARNTGIAAARGEFLMFVDSDDYIDSHMVGQLYQNLTSSGADVASCGLYNVFRQRKIPQYGKIEKFLCTAEKAFGLLLVGEKIPGSSCNKLYRSELFRNLRFPEGILYEDVMFHTELMQMIRTVYVDTTPLYYYIHRSESITTQRFDERAMMFIYAYEQTLKVVKETFPSVLPQAEFKLTWAYFSIFDRMLQQDDYRTIREYGKVRRFLKRNTFRILKSPYFNSARKLGAFILFLNVRCYRLLIRVNDRKNKSIISQV